MTISVTIIHEKYIVTNDRQMVWSRNLYQSSSWRSNPHSNLMLKIIKEITIHTVGIRKETYKSQSRQENIGPRTFSETWVDFLQLLKGGVGIGSSVTFHKSYDNNQVMFSWGLFSMTWPILLSIYWGAMSLNIHKIFHNI